MIIRRACDRCGRSYEAKSKLSKFCSARCRMAASRAGGSVVPIRPKSDDHEGPNAAAYRAKLEELGCVDSAQGVHLLTLARRLDASDRETGNSTASLSREMRAVMAEIRAAVRPASAIDGLRLVRDQSRASIG